MVLRISGRVGYRRFKREVPVQIMYGDFLRWGGIFPELNYLNREKIKLFC